MRNISFALTTPQFIAGTKDVTRRMGWLFLKPGDVLQAIEKGQGLGKGGKVKPLGIIQVKDVRREALRELTDRDDGYGFEECRCEGFPHSSPSDFVQFFCAGHKDCTPDSVVTQIEFVKIATSMSGDEAGEGDIVVRRKIG